MTTQPNDHDLNKVLAKVAGLHWGYCLQTNEHGYFNANDELIEQWYPLTDANQLELVEAGLREKFGEILYIEMACHWSLVQHEWSWKATIKVGCKEFIKIHQYKKRAFAMAVAEMEQHATTSR